MVKMDKGGRKVEKVEGETTREETSKGTTAVEEVDAKEEVKDQRKKGGGRRRH